MTEPSSIAEIFLNPPPAPTEIRPFRVMTANGEVTIDPLDPESWRDAMLPSGSHVSPVAKEVLTMFDDGRIPAMPREQLLELIRALMCGILNLELAAREYQAEAWNARVTASVAHTIDALRRTEASRREKSRTAPHIQLRRSFIAAWIKSRLENGEKWPTAKQIAKELFGSPEAIAGGYAYSTQGDKQPWDVQSLRDDLNYLWKEKLIPHKPGR